MEANTPSIQWFPGHMAKTRRLMAQSLRLVDAVVELRDARVPISSANPEIAGLVQGKPRLLLLNKSDVADPAQNKQWCALYRENGVPALAVDCRSGRGLHAFVPLVQQTLAPLLERRRARGLVGQPLRLMVVGVPNVGKSSFINRMAGERRAKVEDRPGVTRGRQWIKLSSGMELLDMPGVLWPKFDDKWVGENLAFTGAVKDDVVDIEALAMRLALRLQQLYPAAFAQRYRLSPEEAQEPDAHVLLAHIARRRGMLLPGGEVNVERAAITLLDEFRSGAIGRITLEKAAQFTQRVRRER